MAILYTPVIFYYIEENPKFFFLIRKYTSVFFYAVLNGLKIKHETFELCYLY